MARSSPPPSRRAVTLGLVASVTAFSGPSWPRSAQAQPRPAEKPAGNEWHPLTASPARLRLRPEPAPETEVWTFDGEAPGPVLRVRHGEEVRVRLVNRTAAPLSIHWHGVRNINAMDGVGGLTQAPVAPGGSFDYRFMPPDPGTFLMRPLVIGGSSEPAGRGLSGLLVVEEREPPAVDREFALVIGDWLVADEGALSPFGNPLEAAANGRLGNVLTVNGRAVPHELKVARGARLRLRLANACNARTFRIHFDNLRPYVAAVDGQPTDTFEPLRSTLPFAPGSRYDLILDAASEAGAVGRITATIGAGLPLVTLVTTDEAAPKSAARAPIGALAPNKQLPAAIRLQQATRKEVVIGGGARVGPGGQPEYTGDPRRIWTINGTSGTAGGPPLLRVKRGSPVVLTIRNQTPIVQPLHLHGHVFRLLHVADDGWEPYWLDTLQIPEGRSLPIAFHADNPGRWAVSSTVLERFDTGLWTWFEVT
jgi:FtsP/CotA-like multicopper oxidase with cupredoxin domain